MPLRSKSSNMTVPLGNPRNRVLQLDGHLLDDQILNIFQSQLNDAFSDSSLPLKIQRISSRHGKDLIFFIKLLLFKLFLWDKSSTYGLILQNLKLSNNERLGNLNKMGKLFILLHLISSHFIGKLISFTYSEEATELEASNPILGFLLRKIMNYLPIIEAGSSFFEVANRIVFFALGDYTTLFYRLFRIRHERLNDSGVSFASNPQSISYEFQDRQLIWNAFTEFITNVSDIKMPKFVQRAWRKALIKVMKRDKKSVGSSMAFEGVNANEGKNESMFRFLPERCCAICYVEDTSLTKNIDGDLITNPFVTNCGHIYCYFCLMKVMDKALKSDECLGNYDEDDSDQFKKWSCLRCNEKVKWCKIFSEGMDELESRANKYFESSEYTDRSISANGNEESNEESSLERESLSQNESDEESEHGESEESGESDQGDQNGQSDESDGSDESDESDVESAYEYDADEFV